MPTSIKAIGFIVLLGIMNPVGLLAQKNTTADNGENWKLEKDKNGIRVYSRNLTGTRLKELKVNRDLEGNLSQVVAYISGVEHYTESVYRCVEAYLIKQVSESEFLYYNRTDMPWPVADRDLAIRIRFQMDPATRVLSVYAENVPNLVPPKSEYVRVPHWRAVWTARQLDPKRLHIEYRLAIDPGGTLPLWLVNSLAAQGPYQAFSEMEDVLKKSYYQNKTFGFLKSAERAD